MSLTSALAVAKDFLAFNRAAPSPFHAVNEAKQRLTSAGFVRLSESEEWKLQPNGKYFITRNHSTLFAFVVGGKYQAGHGANIIGAHTDSPCLKVKPRTAVTKSGYLEVGVQCYGAGLWYTWFDRDLSLAGRCVLRRAGDKYEHHLVNIDRPILRVPSLAIHLDRSIDEGFKFNKETHLIPILATEAKRALSESGAAADKDAQHHSLLLHLLAKEIGCAPSEIADFELSLYDHAAPVIGGALEEFVFSARLDNLVSSYCALAALIASADHVENESNVNMVTLFDHEEIGSMSAFGAASNMLVDVLTRVNAAFGGSTKSNALHTALRRSFLISADMAHGVHPNYTDKHEEHHRPHLNKGPTIKYNANQRYATTAQTAFLIKELARLNNVPVQEFCVRNDIPCGSTIGPILSAAAGIRTCDLGNPQLSMHSIREQCGVDDIGHAYTLFKAFFQSFSELDRKLQVDE